MTFFSCELLQTLLFSPNVSWRGKSEASRANYTAHGAFSYCTAFPAVTRVRRRALGTCPWDPPCAGGRATLWGQDQEPLISSSTILWAPLLPSGLPGFKFEYPPLFQHRINAFQEVENCPLLDDTFVVCIEKPEFSYWMKSFQRETTETLMRLDLHWKGASSKEPEGFCQTPYCLGEAQSNGQEGRQPYSQTIIKSGR